MADKQHSILSASSSARWLACPPSAVLTKDMPSSPSPYAEEGTEAHELCEMKAQLAFGKLDQAGYNSLYAMFKARSKYWDEEMEEYANSYVELLKEQAEGYKEIYFEVQVDYSHVLNVPNQKGTCDCAILFEDSITIVDFKYGKGVTVLAENNPQMSLYALGACFTLKAEVSKVRMIICQPRIENFSSWDTDFVSLWKWGYEFARERAQLAIEGKGDFCPGEKQCRWCKLRGSCQARAMATMEEAKEVFGEENDVGALIVPEESKALAYQVPLEKLSIILEIAPLYEQWLKDVQAYAYQLAMSGVQIPGYKLVQGRTTRKIDNEEGLVRALTAAGASKEVLYKEPKLLGLGELEKLFGKKKFNEIAAPFVHKPAGAPTLVPESDRRAPINVTELAIETFEAPLLEDGEE